MSAQMHARDQTLVHKAIAMLLFRSYSSPGKHTQLKKLRPVTLTYPTRPSMSTASVNILDTSQQRIFGPQEEVGLAEER